MQMFIPTCIYVAGIKLLGIYVASALLIGWLHGAPRARTGCVDHGWAWRWPCR
ncbi:MAG UNVERIFIED_CONTAM: hypothetical protein LVT10_13750 [Anaerolineae bacterium]|jgi:hypothetical protein